MKIRKAQLNDIKGILQLYNQLMAQHNRYNALYKIHAHAVEEYRHFVINCLKDTHSLVLVAEDKEHAVGFLICRIEKRLPRFLVRRAAYIYDIYVDRKHQSHGAGRRLIRTLTQWVKKKGVAYIKLEVSPKNKKGFDFWKRCGFYIFQYKMACKIA